MDKAERDQRHQDRMECINAVQLVVGTGDLARVDQIGSLLERARLMEEELKSHQSTEDGLAAFERLLRHAEEKGTRQAVDVAGFISAVLGDQPLPLRMLRAQSLEVADDMLAVLDAFRYSRLTLADHIPGGSRRVVRVLGRFSPADA